MKPRLTLRDIAAAAGVTSMTVSLALKNSSRLPLATRKRIKALAARLGYRPDPMLSALASYRKARRSPKFQGTLAWINMFAVPGQMTETECFRLYRVGAEERARELGYVLEEFRPKADRMSWTALARILRNRGITALLIPPQEEDAGTIDFDFDGFSAVSYGFSLRHPRLHVVTNSQFQSAVLAVRTLWDRGFRRIGFDTEGDVALRTERNFLGGFLSEVSQLPGTVTPPFVRPVDKPACERELRNWIGLYQPEVVILPSVGCTLDYSRIGVKMPRDLRAVALDAEDQGGIMSGVSQQSRLIGRTGVDTLVGMIHRNETGIPEVPLRILIPGKWHSAQDDPFPKSKRSGPAGSMAGPS